jgi:hypothetical protein
MQWCREHEIMFMQFGEEMQDYLLSDCVLDQADEEVFSLQRMRDMVAVAQKRYGGRRKFKVALTVIEGLGRGQVVVQAAPFPKELLMCLVVVMTMAAKAASAVALLLCFCGMMRISEVLGLRHQDVLFPSEHRSGPFVVLLLKTSKRGPADGDKIIIDNVLVVRFLERYKARLPPKDALPQQRFCLTSYATVRKWMRQALVALGFPADAFRALYCRRGGATCLSLMGVSLQDVMVAGRWASQASCRLYVRKGEVALMRFQNSLADTTWQRIKAIASIGVRVWTLSDQGFSVGPSPPPGSKGREP